MFSVVPRLNVSVLYKAVILVLEGLQAQPRVQLLSARVRLLCVQTEVGAAAGIEDAVLHVLTEPLVPVIKQKLVPRGRFDGAHDERGSAEG